MIFSKNGAPIILSLAITFAAPVKADSISVAQLTGDLKLVPAESQLIMEEKSRMLSSLNGEIRLKIDSGKIEEVDSEILGFLVSNKVVVEGKMISVDELEERGVDLAYASWQWSFEYDIDTISIDKNGKFNYVVTRNGAQRQQCSVMEINSNDGVECFYSGGDPAGKGTINVELQQTGGFLGFLTTERLVVSINIDGESGKTYERIE